MAKVTLDIPDSKLDEHAKTKIKQLEDKLKRAETKLRKAQDELKRVEYDKDTAKRIIFDMRQMVDEWAHEVDASVVDRW